VREWFSHHFRTVVVTTSSPSDLKEQKGEKRKKGKLYLQKIWFLFKFFFFSKTQ